MLDLVTGRGMQQLALEKKLKFQDVSPSGDLVVYAGRDDRDRADRVSVWNIAHAAQHVALFVPGHKEDEHWNAAGVGQALFTDDAHVLVVRDDHRAILWQLDPFKAVWSTTVRGRALLTPGGKYLVLPGESTIRFVSPATGATAGELLGIPRQQDFSFAIAPSGQQLVAYGNGEYLVWDLSTGALTSDFYAPLKNLFGAPLSVPADGYALIDNSYLVDLTHHQIVWKYTDLRQAVAGPDRHLLCYMVDATRSVGALEPAAIPGQAVEETLKTADFKSHMLLQPGATVTLQISVGTGAEQQAIRANWTKQLAAHGITIDDHSPIRIVASTSTGSGSSDYDVNFQREHVTYQTRTDLVHIEWQGKTAWETAAGGIGGPGWMIQVKHGQTAQQAVNEQQRGQKVDVAAEYTAVRLPALLAKPGDHPYFGESAPSAQ